MNVSESLRPLSQSGVWDIVTRFYHERGLDAWQPGGVPQRITSNAYLADSYATVISAFIRDLEDAGVSQRPLIVEVGAGSALFGWLLVRRLAHHHFGEREQLPFDYLLTDTAAKNIEGWRRIPRLARLFDGDRLHMAVYDIAAPNPVVARSGDGTEFDLTGRPLVIVANYVLDSVRADLIRVRDGQVFQELVAIEGVAVAEDGLPALSELDLAFESRALDPPYSMHDGIDKVIEEYRTLSGDRCIPVPTLVASFLRRFLGTDQPLLMLAGDLAHTTTDFPTEPLLVHEEYFACTTNFHLLGRLFEQEGGSTAFTRRADDHFSAGAFLQPAAGVDLPLTRESASACLAHFSPHDAHNVERAMEVHPGPLDFFMVMGWLRQARFDPYVTGLAIPHLMKVIEAEEATFDGKSLREALFEAYRSELPETTAGESLCSRVAFTFLKARMYEEVVDFLAEAMVEQGRTPVSLHMSALAAIRLDRGAQARAELTELSDCQPSYWDAWPSSDDVPIVDRVLAESGDAVHLDHIVLNLSVQALLKGGTEEVKAE